MSDDGPRSLGRNSIKLQMSPTRETSPSVLGKSPKSRPGRINPGTLNLADSAASQTMKENLKSQNYADNELRVGDDESLAQKQEIASMRQRT